MFTEVSNALNKNPGLKKAIILKHIPRYDSKRNDPHSLKASLSKLYNDTLVQNWLESNLKDRILIGNHDLDCQGAVLNSRYRNLQKNLYDGVHMYGSSGKKAYAESILNILRKVELVRNIPP